MDYYHVLDLKREPFSNSPDPEFLFESRVHLECIQRIELSIRLRRGLNVVTGEVGTGKTTLCRYIIKRFALDESFETHLVLDPSFSNSLEFLSEICRMFLGNLPENTKSHWKLKENIKRYLFRKGVEEKKTLLLVIDEGQKLPDFCIELLREFLNYETNEHKLLQTVIFAQKEFMEISQRHKNFADRISTQLSLGPLSFRETKALIKFRMARAGAERSGSSLFSPLGLWSIYRSSQGYPRKIIHLCHTIILGLIIQNRTRAGLLMARSCAKRIGLEPAPAKKRTLFWAFAGLCAVFIMIASLPDDFRGSAPTGKNTWTFKGAIFEPNAPRKRISRAKDLTLIGPGTLALRMEKAATECMSSHEPANFSQKTSEGAIMNYPCILGEITAGKKDTLGKMIKRVYGIFNREYLRHVVRVNPHITNPDMIQPGDIIRFPAVAALPGIGYNNCWCIEVVRKSSLEAAHDYLKELSELSSFFKIVPSWHKDEGLTFTVWGSRCFHEQGSAIKWLNRLPSSIASKGRVVQGWGGPDTVFFAALPPITEG